jgi:heat shock protein HspQ
MASVTRELLFQVGQIVHHVRYDYRGVIIDSDSTCQAQDVWYEVQTTGTGYKPTKQQPWYDVLVDGALHQTYVAQQNLRPSDDHSPISHPRVNQVFASFLDGRYSEDNLN